MPQSSDHPHVFVSVAEPSADLHAASLIRAVRSLCPDARFSGVAGPLMRQEGCRAIYDMTAHSAMLAAAIGHVHHGLRMLMLSYQELRSQHYDAAVVVDSPVLNLRVARLAKSCGIPVLYYIAPQLWAWGGRARVHSVRSRVDQVACILPFEEPYFRSYGIEASYVGHPLFASLARHKLDPDVVRGLKSGGQPVVGVMPGSRRHVASENFPGQLEVAKALQAEFPGLKVLVSVANSQVKPILEQLASSCDLKIELHEGENAELLSAADLALVSSGTATLEAAYYGTPMIVMYNCSRLYQIVKWIISTRYLSLPNILAEREMVPEFMPRYKSTAPIIRQASRLLRDQQARRRMSEELGALIKPFVDSTASETTAKILLDMIEARAGVTLAA